MSTVPKDAKKSQKKTNLWCMDAISFSFRGVWTLKGLKTSGMHPLIMDLKHHLLILQPVLTLWRLDAEYVSSAFLLPSNCENKLNKLLYIYICVCVELCGHEKQTGQWKKWNHFIGYSRLLIQMFFDLRAPSVWQNNLFCGTSDQISF